ncbi:branched-chain amino acid transporter permease [Fundicoccus culcitae]|uniref:AzlD domain-containing protein n=1 Tax=Fundicoccus culcitae TaxID=2969821 RepID=A0ABY5P8B0_9LACT|nr:AzlD domain-containing protein [Fundicoccus culcitae]UUX34971.1 AzlD domain-containing protein [Fundicoccus culcitae]
MTNTEIIITIIVIAAGTILTRFIAFIIFPPHKTPPKFVQYLSKTLPAAVIGLLVVYAFKDTQLFAYPYALPEIIASIVLVIIHVWKRNTMLTIAISTLLYMFLVQIVFV